MIVLVCKRCGSMDLQMSTYTYVYYCRDCCSMLDMHYIEFVEVKEQEAEHERPDSQGR